MTVSIKNKYIAALAATAVLAVGLYGCGGGGDGVPTTTMPTKVNVDLSDLTPGYMADATMMLEIEAGGSADHGDIRFSCAAGGDDCTVMVMVADDGTITAQSSGGTVTAEDRPPEPPAKVEVDLTKLTPGYMADAIMMLDIAAGQSADHGDIRFSCAAGGDNCTVMVMVADDGTITAQSSGGTVTAEDRPPEPPAKVEVDLTKLTPGYMADAIMMLDIAAGQSADHGDIRFSCAAGGDDCTVMVMVADDGAITAQSSGGTVTAEDRPPAKVEVDLTKLTPGYMADAIMMLDIDAGESADHGDIRFSCAAGGDDCTVMVMVADDGAITAQSSGGTVTAEDAGDANTTRDERLEMAIQAGHSTNSPSLDETGAPSGSPMFDPGTNADYASIPGWDHMAYERENPVMGMTSASTDKLVVYQNMDPETSAPFREVHGVTVDTDGDLSNGYEALGNIASLNPMLVGGNMLPLVVVGNGGTFAGTFDGASGVYTCTDTANNCLLSFDGNGNVIGVTGDMHFTPDEGATVDVLVPDFMYFGYWMNESTDGNNDPVFEIAGLYGGAVPSPYAYVSQLEGSATYEGAATGLYVRRWTDTSSNVLRRRTGQFTADLKLSANFGGGNIAPNAAFQISGTIDEFMDGTKEVDPSWSLELESASFAADANGNTTFSGSTQPSAGAAGMGDWDGHFFGPLTQGNVNDHPSGVAGTFDGHFNNGDVIGAFGAERQDQQP